MDFVYKISFSVFILIGAANMASADVTLTIRDDGRVVYSGTQILPPPGMIPINDAGGTPHEVDGNSVLSVIHTADQASSAFSISELNYYSSFNAFYLRCINIEGTDRCDDWMYKVNGVEPSVGMDNNILTGSENIILYFGNDNAPSASEAAPINNSVASGGAITITPPPVEPSLSEPIVAISPDPVPATSEPTSLSSNLNLIIDSDPVLVVPVTAAEEIAKIDIPVKKIVKNKKVEKVKIQQEEVALDLSLSGIPEDNLAATPIKSGNSIPLILGGSILAIFALGYGIRKNLSI